MRTDSFDYTYPETLVAQVPAAERGRARLLVAHRKTWEIHHTTFDKILDFLDPGDCLVVNQTKVFPARLFGKKETGGSVEIVLLHEMSDGVWKCLAFPFKRIKKDSRIAIFSKTGIQIDQYSVPGDLCHSERVVSCHSEPAGRGISPLSITILDCHDNGMLTIKFNQRGDLDTLLQTHGHIPLPPYIKRPANVDDSDRYQTVFARERGAVAAPTAGLHWNEALLTAARAKGISIVPVTLHVGYGTFSPIRSESIEAHTMHEEYFEISAEAAEQINSARRVVAVGTTTVRALESAYRDGKVQAISGWTHLYITPGFFFQVVDVLQTNFHQPKSSLLVMVSAFAGNDFIRQCYAEAIAQKYFLFSYGDTMLIL